MLTSYIDVRDQRAELGLAPGIATGRANQYFIMMSQQIFSPTQSVTQLKGNVLL